MNTGIVLGFVCSLGGFYAIAGLFGWFDVQPIVIDFLLPWISKTWHPIIIAIILFGLASGFFKEADRLRAKQDARDIRDGK